MALGVVGVGCGDGGVESGSVGAWVGGWISSWWVRVDPGARTSR